MIDKLTYVIALAREQHFGRAAESCGVTQPTMSAGLKQIEDQLGVVIVRRSSRFQGFTPEGEHVLAWARRIVGDAKAMRQDLDALKRGLTGHLRLAIIPTALSMGAALTTPFRDRHPGVRFSIISRSSTDVLKELGNLDVDAGITYLENEPLGAVKTVPLYHEGYRLLTATAGPLGSRQSVSWGELGDVPLCLLTPDMQNRRIIDQMMQDGQAPAAPVLESNSITALLSHVLTGAMVERHALDHNRQHPPADPRPLHSYSGADSGSPHRPRRAAALLNQSTGQRARARGRAPRPAPSGRRHPSSDLMRLSRSAACRLSRA